MPINIRKYIKDNIIAIGLIITLIVGLILRFKGLTFQSYWTDELYSIAVSNPSNSFSSMYHETVTDVHPPLYQSLLWVWYHIFGFSEYSGRSMSVVIGSMGIYAVYILGKEFFNKETGLYAAVIASMNYYLIYFSQTTRSNSLLFLLSIISYIYFIKVLTTYSKKNFLLYLLFTIALVYTHYFGLVLVATQVFVFLFYFIKEKEKRKLLTVLAVTTAVTISVSLLPLLEYILGLEGMKSYWMPMPSKWFALEYMKIYVKSQYLEGIFLFTISLSLIYLFKKTENVKYRTMTIVLLLWIIIGYLLPYIRSVTALPMLVPRSTIMIIPALILLISYGIFLLKDTRLKTVMMAVIVFFSVYQLDHTNYYGKVTKEQWREVLYEVAKAKEKIPLFGVDRSDWGYIIYSSMLNLDLNISNSKALNKHYNNGTLPKCFFITDAHGDNISKSKELQDKTITKVLEIKKRKARGVLYAYKTPHSICSLLYAGEMNIDFNKCSLSKPYKGNPLAMPWSGSVTTPIYELKKNNYDLIVNAKGTKAFDKYAKLKIQVFRSGKDTNSLFIEKIFDTKQDYTEFTTSFKLQQDTNVSFVVSFINDKSRAIPKEDRNVYLKSIILKKQ